MCCPCRSRWSRRPTPRPVDLPRCRSRQKLLQLRLDLSIVLAEGRQLTLGPRATAARPQATWRFGRWDADPCEGPF